MVHGPVVLSVPTNVVTLAIADSTIRGGWMGTSPQHEIARRGFMVAQAHEDRGIEEAVPVRLSESPANMGRAVMAYVGPVITAEDSH